jgi:6-phosphogluconolactonase
MRRIPSLGLALVTALTVSLAAAAMAQASSGSNAVYTLTNEPGANAVAAFDRGHDGRLTPAGRFRTGGTGTGGSLGNQGALVFGRGSRHLYAVNAGSDEISAMAVRHRALKLVDKVGSGGDTPVSVTVHGDLLYVLNAGGEGAPGNISGFRIGHRGQLRPIPGSSRPLSAEQVAPAQVQFDPSGGVLVVTEKATNVIDTYTVGRDGRASGPDVFAASGQTPFGFAFAGDDTLLVSEAFGGTASALSSYDTDRDGGLATISPSVFAGAERASCWVVVTDDGRVAFTTNTASGTISSYAIGRHGRLSLLDDVAVQQGGSPIDAALTRGSRFLYVLNSAQNRIGAYRVGSDGSLTTLTGFGASGLPAGANGLVAG